MSQVWLRACDRAGPAAVLEGRPFIENRGRLVIGDRLRLASRPVQSHLIVAKGGVLEIGDDVCIAHGAAISAHRRVQIGDGARVAPFVVISDTDYHIVGSRHERAEPAPIIIGRGVRVGSRVTIRRGTVIGDGARIAPGSVAAGEVPAGAYVAGVPARLVSDDDGLRAGAEDTTTAVLRTVARTFRLAELPSLSSGPAEIPAWDSLGTLNLLIKLEEELGLTIDEAELRRVRRIEELIALVEALRAKTIVLSIAQDQSLEHPKNGMKNIGQADSGAT